jgi:hypothetical protein
MALIAVIALLPNLAGAVIFDYFITKPDTRILAQEWLISNAPSKAKIGFERYTPIDLKYMDAPRVSKIFNAVDITPSLGLYPANFYKQEGFDYIVTSDFRSNTYKFLCQRDGFCEEWDNYLSFSAQFTLVKEFSAPKLFALTGFSAPWGTWPHHPAIKIYKIK